MREILNSLRDKRVGLALSGGAVRGLAHIGVIKALEEEGIRPAAVTGTSVGSIIGAALAAGMRWQEMAYMAKSVFWPKLLNGKSLERFATKYLPAKFDQLQMPFAAIATHIPANQSVPLTSGDLPSAISASCALRLLRRAVKREGLQLKDGGFSCVLPTQVCRELGAEIVIGSDVWEWSSIMRSLGHSPTSSHWSVRAYPSHYRSALTHADIHVQPTIPASGYVPGAFAVERMIAVGERATKAALNSLPLAQAA
jgi:NTE family protein